MADTALLQRALDLACANVHAGGGPFGAVIADGDGHIVAEGVNVVTPRRDPTAHAEITAIRRACRNRGDHRLEGLTLYSSCEPCPMCLAAAWWARLDGVIFASTQTEAAAAGFDDAALWQALRRGQTAPQLPLRQLSLPATGEEFRLWLRHEDRQPY